MISIIIPAKNEEIGLKKTLQAFEMIGLDAEIIVVDDGSTDNTASVALELGATVISHPYSKGNGAAIKSGARAANGDVFVFMDADGQHAPEDIPKLLEMMSEGYDMVVGARDSGAQANVMRYVANAIYNKLAGYMTGKRIDDLTSGLRVVNALKFREFISLLPNGFSYPTTITMAFFRAGYSVGYYSASVSKRHGKSHINPLKDGVRFLLIIFKISTLYSPLKIFFPMSFLIFVLGLIRYAYTYATVGSFTNMSATLFVASAQVFLIGLVAEQITTLMYKDDK